MYEFLNNPVLFVGMGFLAGALAALLGVGGGVLIVPFLTICGMPMALAVPTSVAYIAFSSLTATVQNYRKDNLSIKACLIVGAFIIPVVDVCSRVMRHLKTLDMPEIDIVLRVAFVGFVILSIALVLGHSKDGAVRGPVARLLERMSWRPYINLGEGRNLSFWVLCFAALWAGSISGLLGLGGGQILFPVFLAVLAFPPRLAVGNSTCVVMLTAVYGTISYALMDMIVWREAGLLIGGSMLGARAGTVLLHRSDGGRVKSMFVALSVVSLAALGLRHYAGAGMALILLTGFCLFVLCFCAWRCLRQAQHA